MVDVEQIQNICSKFAGTTEDIKWEEHLCFSVGKKMYLMLGLGGKVVNASFKVNHEDFDIISAREGFKPAPYLARYNWVAIDNINRLDKKEWTELIKQSYTLVKSKLSKKLRQEIDS